MSAERESRSDTSRAAPRMEARAREIAFAVRRVRKDRGQSIRTLAGRVGISPSTLARLEKPDPDEPMSPKVETLEALAQGLGCQLRELLGGPSDVQHRDLGDWPDALKSAIASRGGLAISTVERAYLESVLQALYRAAVAAPEQPAEAGMTLKTEPIAHQASGFMEDPNYWLGKLRGFRHLRRWRVIEKLVEATLLDELDDAMRGIEFIVDATLTASGQSGFQLFAKHMQEKFENSRLLERVGELERELEEARASAP